MANTFKPRSFGTHDGSFHADEVTACALLLLFNLIDTDKIVRTRDLNILKQCEFVCDVGGTYDPQHKKFDHHQADYHGPMSSAGMILLYLKEHNCISEPEYNFFHNNIILGVDEHDNGRDPLIPGLCTYSHIIASYVPFDENTTTEKQNKAFFDALHFARDLLERLHQKFLYMQECRELVRNAMETGKECLLFDRYIPWMEVFFDLGGANHPALFVIMPSGNHWKLRGIPPSLKDKMKVRMPLPKEWAGQLEQDLRKITGINGAIFCHKGRFISVWETREDAIKALKSVLGKEKF